MARGTILADNWLATISTVVVDAATSAVDTGANSMLTDYESGLRVEYDIGTLTTIDIVFDAGAGVTLNPNSAAVINNNMSYGAANFGSVVVTSADDAAQTVNASTLATVTNEGIPANITAPYNTYIKLTEGSAARRYFRFRFTDTSRAAGENLKIGQIFLGSDQMTAPQDRTTYTAPGLEINFNAGIRNNYTNVALENRTLGGVMHSFNLYNPLTISNIFFEAMDITMLRRLVTAISSRGVHPIERYNNEEPLTPVMNTPIIWVPDVSQTFCIYCDVTQAPLFPLFERVEPAMWDVGPFGFREQGLGV
jgi:hypothetical protein